MASVPFCKPAHAPHAEENKQKHHYPVFPLAYLVLG